MSQGTTIEARRQAGPANHNGGGVGSPGDPGVPERLDTTLARRYHLTRLVIAAVILLISLALVIHWGWWAGLFVTGVAVGAGTDAWMRWAGRWSRSAMWPLLVDSTAVGVATVIGQLPVEAVVPPFAYVLVSAFMLLRVRSALW